MHDHNAGPHVVDVLFTAANLVIALGYVAVPFMVLRYLPLTRLVLAWGVVFFAGCAGTHLGMALLMHHVDSWFWTLEHMLQAVGTWGFIITFTAMLRKASERRPRTTPAGGDVVASPAEDGGER